MSNPNISKVENIKDESDYLAGEIAKQLNDKSAFFKDSEVQLLKFHGTYQQFNRDTATELKKKGLAKEYYFKIRTKIPWGTLSAKQYIDEFISDNYPEVSILTTVCGGVPCPKPHKNPSHIETHSPFAPSM